MPYVKFFHVYVYFVYIFLFVLMFCKHKFYPTLILPYSYFCPFLLSHWSLLDSLSLDWLASVGFFIFSFSNLAEFWIFNLLKKKKKKKNCIKLCLYVTYFWRFLLDCILILIVYWRIDFCFYSALSLPFYLYPLLLWGLSSDWLNNSGGVDFDFNPSSSLLAQL